jgi:putative transposase
LWRAVDQNGAVLDILVQSRRNAKAAKRLPRKILKKQGIAPRVMITESWPAMMRLSERSCRVSSTANIAV